MDKELEESKNAIRILGGKIEKKIQYELNGNGRSIIVILKENIPNKYTQENKENLLKNH